MTITMETEALAQDFEPWSPGFHARDAPPWDDTNDNSQQPFGSKEMSRRTISTIDMLSPRRHSESFEPWSPGFQFHSKVDPWETKDDSQKSRMCEDFEPWSPGFQFHSKGDPWDDETNETNDDVNKPRMAKDIFRNTRPRWTPGLHQDPRESLVHRDLRRCSAIHGSLNRHHRLSHRLTHGENLTIFGFLRRERPENFWYRDLKLFRTTRGPTSTST